MVSNGLCCFVHIVFATVQKFFGFLHAHLLVIGVNAVAINAFKTFFKFGAAHRNNT